MSELFEELHVAGMTARNRLVRAATAESLCTKEGAPSPRMCSLYRELAQGRVGTIITGYAYVSADGKPSERSLNLSATAAAGECRQLVAAAHDDGARIVAQLVYGGSKSPFAAESGQPVLGPSAIAHPKTGVVPRAATPDDLARVCAAFASAAERAQSWGFDGVEIHAAHGYLLSQFLDGRFNQRTDEYGGPLRNRALLALQCVQAVRQKVGPDYPVFVKLNRCDVFADPAGQDGGLSEDESMQVAEWLVEAGASCIDVSGDWHAVEPENVSGEPFFGDYAARLARWLDGRAAVIATGGWRDRDTIERYLSTTGIAGVGLSRPLICQSNLPMRWEDGDDRPSECISCNWCVNKPGIPCILRKGR